MVYQIRYETNERTIVGYKSDFAGEDPIRSITPRLTSTRFRDPIVDRPENAVTGVMSDESHVLQPADWVVTNADHWVYANTGLTTGSILPDLVYYEWDSVVNNGATPSGLTVLASSVVPGRVQPGGRHGLLQSTFAESTGRRANRQEPVAARRRSGLPALETVMSDE